MIHFWITNVTSQVDSAVQILDEKDEDHLNECPCHSFRGIKTNLSFKFIACVMLVLFKKLLTEKYHTLGLKRLRRYVIKQPAMLYYRDGTVQVDMHGKKQKARFNELRECMQETVEEIMRTTIGYASRLCFLCTGRNLNIFWLACLNVDRLFYISCDFGKVKLKGFLLI